MVVIKGSTGAGRHGTRAIVKSAQLGPQTEDTESYLRMVMTLKQ